MAVVGVCEDDAPLRSLLVRVLSSVGHDVVVTATGGEAVRAFTKRTVDLLILDIGLPDSDGRDLCLALRGGGVSCPVLFLTARDGLHDKIAGFEAGADDYLTKPFEVEELRVRVTALLKRRTQQVPVGHPADGSADQPVAPGPRLDPARHALVHGAGEMALTPTEFRILARLMSAPGTVVRRSALVAAGWPHGAMVSDNTLDSYLRRLRTKLDALDHHRAITTVRGVGYRWR